MGLGCSEARMEGRRGECSLPLYLSAWRILKVTWGFSLVM